MLSQPKMPKVHAYDSAEKVPPTFKKSFTSIFKACKSRREEGSCLSMLHFEGKIEPKVSIEHFDDVVMGDDEIDIKLESLKEF